MDNDNYLESVHQQFLYYKALGEKAMAQLEPGQLFIKPNEDCNSVAIIVQHMTGNMLSRWTDFLTSDGEKAWRDRDTEFEVILTDKESVRSEWEKGWHCLMNVITTLQSTHLNQKVCIRKEPLTVTAAINRQLAHYSYHVGQIVFYAKQIRGIDFTSLSIPKNESGAFNKEKFGSQ